MLVRSLAQLNFRNLVTPRLKLEPGLTALVGPNAAGKSNLLDAIYLGVTGELPGGKIIESVRLGEQEGYVGIELEHDEGRSRIEIGLAPGRKQIRLDGQAVRSLDLARLGSGVLITPEDAGLVHGPPSRRRSFLDALLTRLSLRYAFLLREYNRVVEQRNALLKEGWGGPSLAVWDDKFIELGDAVWDLRARAVGRLSLLARSTYADVARDTKVLDVTLETTAGCTPLAEALEGSRREERARGTTVVGPHRDDLGLTLNGHKVQVYGSRGEARTVALALRVGEYRLLEEKHGEEPVLLLDDFSAELDPERRAFLLKLATETPQALVSGTEAPPDCDRRFTIRQGEIREG